VRRPTLAGPARRRAVVVLDGLVDQFRRAGYDRAERLDDLRARVHGPGRRALEVRLAGEGRVFGGTYALEVATADPVVEPTRGLTARGRGLVTLRTVAFRARRGDAAGRRAAAALEACHELVERLSQVHFERIRVEPDGRAVIRHMGGSVVWVLFPPIVKPIPLVAEQVRAVVAAMEAFPSRNEPAERAQP
jgi:hypothetical protein